MKVCGNGFKVDNRECIITVLYEKSCYLYLYRNQYLRKKPHK